MDIYFNKKTLHCDKIMEVWYDLLAKIVNRPTAILKAMNSKHLSEIGPNLILDNKTPSLDHRDALKKT